MTRILALGTLILAACGNPSDSSCNPLGPDSTYVYCAGQFAPGAAASLCPAGYHLASGPMPSALNQACALNAAFQAKNLFFAVDVGSWTNPDPAVTENSCSPRTGWLPSLRGCGIKQDATELAATDCQGWPQALICAKDPGWGCPDGTLGTATNTNPLDGVVCVRN